MKIRPTSVTVISWILIVLGGISLISITLVLNNPRAEELLSRNNPVPIPVQYAMIYGGMIVMIVSGLSMLKRRRWARLLYVIWSAVAMLVSVTTSPMKTGMIPGFVIYVVVVFFLFRPKANQYFSNSEVESAPESH
jgi:hypothetical protein